MSNILQAIHRIALSYQTDISTIVDGNNRMNSMGEGLEVYIKNIFADTLFETDTKKKLKKISQTFSYTGNKTNPPDMILRGGDAIEVKKIESPKSNLQLNSSHPKAKLHIGNPKISEACRECEAWEEKDIIYTIGHIKKKNLYGLWMVYGDCYAASEETYTKAEQKIKTAIEQIGDLEINYDTNELGGVQNIDPLNITYLRVRGMWIIQNPSKVYEYLYEYDSSALFQMVVIMRKEKYFSFSLQAQKQLEDNPEIIIDNVKLQDPNNPANLLDAKLITFKVLS